MSQAIEDAVLQPLEHDVPILTEGKLDLQGSSLRGLRPFRGAGGGQAVGDPEGGGQPRHLKL